MRANSSDSTSRVWKFFTSVKLTVTLLLSLAVTSIIGTVIPQSGTASEYFQKYGELWYKILSFFDSIFEIFDMYHSWWFQLLILLLTMNIIICSIDRMKATLKIIFVKTPSFNLSRFRNIKYKKEFSEKRMPNELEELYKPIISKKYGYSRTEKTDNGFCLFAEKWRWTRLGVYIVHLSIIFMLLGGLIGSIFGFEGIVNIPEGESANKINLRNTDKTHLLDFEIKCEDFFVSFHDNGSPKEFRSSLVLIKNGKPVLTKDIIMNDPIRYKGINIFQHTYGTLTPKEVTLGFTNKETGMEYRKKAVINKPVDIPAGMGTFIIKEYRRSAGFKGHNIGEAFIGVLTPKTGDPINILLPLRFPSFDKMRKGEMIIAVVSHEHNYFTGLQVTKDPGVWVVYSGFILIIIGCFVTFFMSHQRLCIEVIGKENHSTVMISGTSNKNKMGMQRKIEIMSEKLEKLG
ncbi:MAG: cytochrome c biogenesis protein ResB [Desulfobacterales bacterium]|nr:cytochrome c biogenesis protein ResB [Deltaproteobacteria bacterium]NNL40958.1 cytochrome c biogenesis protein ResB [Desulfobacterales bacterium]